MSSPVLPPPPLDHPLEDRSGRAAVPWARWLQQLWDVSRNVVDSTASTHAALTLVNVGATGAPNATASTISAAQVLELELATAVFPGLLTASGFSKLEGIATGATAEVDADGTHAGRVTLGAQVLGSGTKTVDALVSTGAITAGGVAVLTQTNTVAGITNKTFTTPTINGATVSGTFTGALIHDVGAAGILDVTARPSLGSLGPTLRLMNTVGGANASVRFDFSTYDTGGNAPGGRWLITDDGTYGQTVKLQTKTPGAISNSLVDRMTFDPAGAVTFSGPATVTGASTFNGFLTANAGLGAVGANGALSFYVTNTTDTTWGVTMVGSGQARMRTDFSGRWMSFAPGAGTTDVAAVRGNGMNIGGTSAPSGSDVLTVSGSSTLTGNVVMTGTPAYDRMDVSGGYLARGGYGFSGYKDAGPSKAFYMGMHVVTGGAITPLDDLVWSMYTTGAWSERMRLTNAGALQLSSGGSITINSVAVPTISSSDTLTNKTLTSPTINSATVSGTFSGPLTLAAGATSLVASSSAADDVLQLKNSNAAGFASIQVSDSSGSGKGAFGYSNASTGFLPGTFYWTSAVDKVFANSGTEQMRIAASGAVTMASTLDLAGLLNINNTILVRTGTNGVAFWKTSSGGNSANVGMSIPGGAASDDLILSTSDTFTWSERMRIANGGAITMGGTLAVTSTISASNFSGTHSGASSGTNTGDFTLAAVGTNPNANGATRSAQVLNLELASASFPGLITAAQFTKLLNTSGTNTGDSPLTVKDEGSTLSSAVTSLDFVGGGVVATNTGGAVTVTIGTTTATTLTSATANPSSAGIVRLANADAIGWRNNANSGNLLLGATSSDRLSFSSDNVVTAGSTDTLTNKTLSAAALTGTFTGSASFTGTLTITTNIINGSIRSSTANPASGGMIRLANNLDGIFWRNNANTTDLGLIANSSDRLQFAGVTLVGTSTTDTLTAKTLTTPTINGAALSGTLSGSPDFSGAPTIASSPVLTNDVAGPGVVPGGRLTLTTGVPVTTSDVTGVTTHYYAPYLHNRIQLWDGTRWQWWTFSQLSQVSTDTTKSPAAVSSGNNYDIFVWSDSGTLRATRGPAWTSGTARGTGVGTTELLAQDGRYLNKIAITNGPAASRGLYVGTLHTGPSGFYDTKRLRWCWNMFNRVSRQILQVESTASWNYTTATDRPANNTTTNSIEMVRGLDEDAVSAQLIGSCVNTSTGVTVLVSFGLDSTSVRATGSGATLASIATAVVNGRTPLVANYSGCPGLGYHYLQWLEFSVATGVTTWFGANETGITGLAVS